MAIANFVKTHPRLGESLVEEANGLKDCNDIKLSGRCDHDIGQGLCCECRETLALGTERTPGTHGNCGDKLDAAECIMDGMCWDGDICHPVPGGALTTLTQAECDAAYSTHQPVAPAEGVASLTSILVRDGGYYEECVNSVTGMAENTDWHAVGGPSYGEGRRLKQQKDSCVDASPVQVQMAIDNFVKKNPRLSESHVEEAMVVKDCNDIKLSGRCNHDLAQALCCECRESAPGARRLNDASSETVCGDKLVESECNEPGMCWENNCRPLPDVYTAAFAVAAAQGSTTKAQCDAEFAATKGVAVAAFLFPASDQVRYLPVAASEGVAPLSSILQGAGGNYPECTTTTNAGAEAAPAPSSNYGGGASYGEGRRLKAHHEKILD